VKDWVAPSKSDAIGFTQKPNLSQVVVVSYSPFETFPVDLQGEKLQDQEAYRYYGLSGRVPSLIGKRLGMIRLSHGFPKRNATAALINCLSDDKRDSAIKAWAQKVRTMERVLRCAFDFDFAAVCVDGNCRPESFYNEPDLTASLSVKTGDGED